MTNKQLNDIEIIEYFIPEQLKYIQITEEDKKKFLEYSEQGLHKPDEKKRDGFNTLVWGKRWRGRSMEMWEEGILEGSVPFRSLLGGQSPKEIIPRNIVDFIKKEMFKGHSKDNIESTYREVLKYWSWWRKLIYRLNKNWA